MQDHAERMKEANAIFSKHLAVGASEPVNVDSKARTMAQDRLNYADEDLFSLVSCKTLLYIRGKSIENSNLPICPLFMPFQNYRPKSKYST